MCTYCDWGGTTYGKVNKFDMGRVQDRWSRKMDVVYTCSHTNVSASFESIFGQSSGGFR